METATHVLINSKKIEDWLDDLPVCTAKCPHHSRQGEGTLILQFTISTLGPALLHDAQVYLHKFIWYYLLVDVACGCGIAHTI